MSRRIRYASSILLFIGLGFFMSGCSTVPKEVVELSYRMGEDTKVVHKSYKSLIHQHYEALKKERVRYLEEQWIPSYIKTWVEDGKLKEVAKGDIVWSEEKGDFTKPMPGKEDAGLLSTVTFWSTTAVQEIQGKKEELLAPLDKQEEELTSWVDDAFNQLYRGNATITAHLNSLRKVQEVQDDALVALNLKEMRDKINTMLATSSEKAKDGLEAVKKADGFVQDAKKKLQK